MRVILSKNNFFEDTIWRIYYCGKGSDEDLRKKTTRLWWSHRNYVYIVREMFIRDEKKELEYMNYFFVYIRKKFIYIIKNKVLKKMRKNMT